MQCSNCGSVDMRRALAGTHCEAGLGEVANVPCSLADQAGSRKPKAAVFVLCGTHLEPGTGNLGAGKAPPAIYAISFGIVGA